MKTTDVGGGNGGRCTDALRSAHGGGGCGECRDCGAAQCAKAAAA